MRISMQLWDWRTGDVKMQLFNKSFTIDSWPLLQLTGNEDLVLHQAGASVNVYDPNNFQKGQASATSARLAQLPCHCVLPVIPNLVQLQ